MLEPEVVVSRADKWAGWFGVRLKELRTKQGLSQAALAKAIGVAQSRIAEYESRTTAYRPSWETVIRCAIALDVDPSAFLREPAPEKIQNPD